MSGARDEILARVRAARGSGSGSGSGTIPREYRGTLGRPQAELVALFCERAADYRAEVERVGGDDLPEAVGRAAARHGARRLGIPSPRFPLAWRPPDLELVADESLSARELDGLDGAITGCTAAVAETGTIALTSGAQEGRRLLSLVPDLHICLVDAAQVVGTVPEAITRLGAIVRGFDRPVTLISGPSATSDIELQRVEGVHGPRRLVVLVVDNLNQEPA